MIISRINFFNDIKNNNNYENVIKLLSENSKDIVEILKVQCYDEINLLTYLFYF